ncbi:aspartate kinase [Desulfohalotomaculum tongense]|uniref:aspartate kinase n=1 Tax=Desulforadius tongensis TaxID=1216062 RepID=UPI00195DD089|nr:aspartate kinase [Desulforadius tongensis]MBM7854458.1 aspartate kinase [Desulforadius tongensis]
MRFLIQKFGGTSLTTPEFRKEVAAKVVAAQKQGFSPVVVVSAIGRYGAPYATDTLISVAKQVNRDVPPRELDLLMSCGEVISGVVMVNTLLDMGCQAVFLTGAQAGIITDANFNDARILRVEPQKIIEQAEQGKVVVVAGFQGVTEEGEITTLGRGGSDTTAAALGVALDAECIDIYTDVDGVMTADPRIVDEAQILDKVTYNEICQLAHEGAKVIHPRAVEIAMQKNIPMRVKSTFSNAPGTLVTNHGEVYGGTIDIIMDRIITGITHVTNITQIIIPLENVDIANPHLKVFKGMALAGISVDFWNVNLQYISFTVKDNVADKAKQVLENMGITPLLRSGCAKVAAVGAGMTGVPGVMASVVEALTRENVEILQSSDSHTTIWVLVKEEDIQKAVVTLHRQFMLGNNRDR